MIDQSYGSWHVSRLNINARFFFEILADITTIFCNGSKLRFLFDNAKKCDKVKRIIKIDGEVQPVEKREAASLGISLLDISEVEVSFLRLTEFVLFLCLEMMRIMLTIDDMTLRPR